MDTRSEIIEVVRGLLEVSFPELNVGGDKLLDRIDIGFNAGNDPYVGVYLRRGAVFFAVLSESHALRMGRPDDGTYTATVLIRRPTLATSPNSEGPEEYRFVGRNTVGEIVDEISTLLSEFKPYQEPWVVCLDDDCALFTAMTREDYDAEVADGNVPGNKLGEVLGEYVEDALRNFCESSPRTDAFRAMIEESIEAALATETAVGPTSGL